MRNVFLIIAVFLSSTVSYATIIDIPGDYSSIQGGIDASSYGDTVLVQPGIYYENINFNGHCIVLCSNFLFTGDTSFISSTIIDGNDEGRVITIANYEDSSVVVAGFTIQNGRASSGAGFLAFNGPTIRDNIIRDNYATAPDSASASGGGICCGGRAKIINNKILNNRAYGGYDANGYGGGITCFGTRTIIRDNIIIGNIAGGSWHGDGKGGGINCSSDYAIITGNVIADNLVGGGVVYGLGVGGGIYLNVENILIKNNTIVDNQAQQHGGSGILVDDSLSIIVNNIIWNNIISAWDYSTTVSYCNIEGGWEGEGNIDADPLFVDPYNYNYNIYSGSPCIDAGDPRYTDPDSTRSDIGVFFPEHPSPGNIWYVALWGNDTTGTGEPDNPFRTIQHAINTSFFEDTIIVRPGTYSENVDIVAEKVLLASNYIFTGDTSDISRTIIENPPDFDSSIVDFIDCDTSLTLMGFTIKDGISSGIKCVNASPRIIRNKIQNNSGSGILLLESDPVIDSNYIFNNSYDSTGGGISCYLSHPVVSNNIIDSNLATYGGGIYGGDSRARITGNLIRSNHSSINGGALNFESLTRGFRGNMTPFISGNRIIGNSADSVGGAIYSDSTTAVISNNVIIYNTATFAAGGIYCSGFENVILNNTIAGNIVHDGYGGGLCLNGSNSKMTNTIIGGNSASYGSQIYTHISEPVITFCNIEGGWAGYGNINTAPLFRNPSGGDFHLMATYCGDPHDSPCIDAGNPVYADSVIDCSWGLGDSRSDMGAYGGGDSLGIGRTIYIPDDFLLIQEAINASYDGDTILVRPGVYMENIEFLGRKIILSSLLLTTQDTSYITSTIIDGDSSGSVVTFYNGEDSTSVLNGFTIRNGFSQRGGGIYCNSDPIIQNNIITQNIATELGGGVLTWLSVENAVIRDNKIINNKVINGSGKGGGVFLEGGGSHGGEPVILRCEIKGNSATGTYGQGGGIYNNGCNPIISNSLIHGNIADLEGGGIYDRWTDGIIKNVVVYGNETVSDTSKGGGIYGFVADGEIVNTIIWGNRAYEGLGIYDGPYSDMIISYSNIQDTLIPAPGNISIDPLFRDPDSNDFHLMATYCGDPYDSPCIDAGDPAIVDTLIDCLWGLGTIRSDMGAYSGGDEDQTGIDEHVNRIPTSFSLFQNYPNPFNPSTTIKYQLPSNSKVKLDVYNLLGQKVKSLVNEWQTAGYKAVHWDASGYASGIYFYKLTAGKFTETKRMLLLK